MDAILDGDKLDAAILALCSSTELSRGALDRALFLADMAGFAETGRPITGSSYLRGRNGPVSADLDAAIRLLVAQGRLKRDAIESYGQAVVSYLSIEPYDLGALSEDEIETLGSVGSHVRGRRDARWARLLVDETVGSFALGEAIPYDCAWELVPFETASEGRTGHPVPAMA